MTLLHLFDLSLVARRDRPALEFQDSVFTFGDLDRRSNQLAQVLQARGLRAGDRLCVYLANCVEMIDLYLACVKLGVIFVPINILYRDREMAHILGDAEPAAVIAEPAELPPPSEPAMPPPCPMSVPPRPRWRFAGWHHLYLRHHRRFPKARSSPTTTSPPTP